MSVRLTVTVSGQERLNRQLDQFRDEMRDFQRHARRIGGYVRTDAKKNIRSQRTVDGAPFSPRAKERSKHRAARRLLQGLADPVSKGRAMSIVSRAGDGGGVEVTWRNEFTGQIAAAQQYGTGNRRMNAKKAKREKKDKLPFYDDPCTRKQAQALIKEGYRLMVPAKGGGRGPGRNKFPKKVTVLWLEKHFTLGHAGLVLRIMRTEKLTGKKSWETGIPPRPFLGVTPAQAEKHCEKLAQAIARAAAKAGR